MQVTLNVPALFSVFSEIDDADLDKLELSAITKLLSRSKKRETESSDYEVWLYQRFSGQHRATKDIPFAGLTAVLDGLDGSLGIWMRADPVYLYPDTHSLVMQDPRHLNLTIEESETLASEIRSLFDDYGAVLHTPVTARWYLVFKSSPPDMQCTPLFDALMKPANRLLPDGMDSRRWHTLFNEVQMVLNQSAVNQARERNGQQPINSLWFWGIGQMPDTYATDFDSCIGGDEYVEALCQLTGCRYQPLKQTLVINEEDASHVLIVFDELLMAARTNDPERWLRAIRQLNDGIIEPLLNRLKQGEINKLTLVSNTAQIRECTASDIKSFWKRVRSVSALLSGRQGS